MDEHKAEQACPVGPTLSISDPSAAEEISRIMLAFTNDLERSAKLVHETCPLEEWKTYKKAAGTIYFDMFVYVLEPLYKKYPSLKPPNWD